MLRPSQCKTRHADIVYNYCASTSAAPSPSASQLRAAPSLLLKFYIRLPLQRVASHTTQKVELDVEHAAKPVAHRAVALPLQWFKSNCRANLAPEMFWKQNSRPSGSDIEPKLYRTDNGYGKSSRWQEWKEL